MKKLLTISAVAAASLVGAGSAIAQVNLTGETANPGGIPHVSMTHLGEVAAREKVANIQIASGQTLTNTLQNIAEGKTDVGSVPFILGFLLQKGRGPYSALGAEKGAKLASGVRLLYPQIWGAVTLYSFDSTGLKGWKDLKGRTVLNGPPRGAALNNARAIVQLASGYKDGKDYKGLQVNWGQMVKTMTDGSAHAFVLPVSYPDSRITPALASGSITIWSVPKAVFGSKGFQRYAKAPGNALFVRPRSVIEFAKGVTLKSEDDNYRGVSTIGGEMVNARMSFDLAKKLTAVHIKTLDELKSRSPVMANAGLGVVSQAATGVCGPNPVKYHPGAVAAWEEAGRKIPECAKPK